MLAMRLRDMADEKNHDYLIGEEEEYQTLAEKIESEAEVYAEAGYYDYIWKPEIDRSKIKLNRLIGILRSDGFKIKRRFFKNIYVISW